MKKNILSFILLLAIQNLFGQNNTAQKAAETGIVFIHDDFNAAITEAKKTGKIIFLDAYTEWCGPCKMMSRNVFPNAEVASFYNANFVNLKMDMEKGDGPNIQNKYAVRAYPTLLYIDGEGKVVHRAVGYRDPAGFLAIGKQIMGDDETLGGYEKKYQSGNRDPRFLKKYALKLAEALDPRRIEVAGAYLKTQTDWKSDENIAFISSFTESAASPTFKFFVENKALFAKKTSVIEVDERIQSMVQDCLFNEKNPPRLSYADSLISLAFLQKAPRMQAKYRLDNARMRGDRPAFAAAASTYFKIYNDSAEELEDIAATFEEQIDDPKALEEAAKWAELAYKKDPSVSSATTAAKIYDKIGKKKKMKKMAKKAIATAKKNKETAEEAETLLKK